MNIFVFVALQQLGGNEAFTYSFACVPQEIVSGQNLSGHIAIPDSSAGQVRGYIDLPSTSFPVYLTLFTSLFLHAGTGHIVGNMLYLWIFGDNLEDAMGHWRYLVFYLTCGLAASLCHVWLSMLLADASLIPSIGASGAISGVMGGYILLFPRRRVTVIFMRRIMQVPAFWALGSWILFQLIESAGFLGRSHDAGVAYAAHIGGFVAGLVLVKVFARGARRPAYRGI